MIMGTILIQFVLINVEIASFDHHEKKAARRAKREVPLHFRKECIL